MAFRFGVLGVVAPRRSVGIDELCSTSVDELLPGLRGSVAPLVAPGCLSNVEAVDGRGTNNTHWLCAGLGWGLRLGWIFHVAYCVLSRFVCSSRRLSMAHHEITTVTHLEEECLHAGSQWSLVA